eukprot:14409254-Alexandrium_andersonii.AAC.1
MRFTPGCQPRALDRQPHRPEKRQGKGGATMCQEETSKPQNRVRPQDGRCALPPKKDTARALRSDRPS